jgi:nucleoside-triphosphatase THEP1
MFPVHTPPFSPLPFVSFTMTFVAVTGPVGSGKTSLLSQLVQWAKSNERRVDGFLALPIDRIQAQRGANRYDLLWVATEEQRPYARRSNSLQPPYEFDSETAREVGQWAAALATAPPLGALVLDEFGPMEAAGDGHARHWDALRQANAEVMVIAVRDSYLDAVQNRLGIQFDVIVDAVSKDALARLKNVCLHHADWTIIGAFGAAAGGFEAFVGSALHAAQIPFRGLFLSSVQSVVMMYAGERIQQQSRVVGVPLISAGLKAFSPMGNRLRPMLAISTQGIFFGAAVAFLGWNVFGLIVGGWLVGAWAATLGILFQYLFIGGDLLLAYDTILQWLIRELNLGSVTSVTLLLLWATAWGCFSAGVTLLAWIHRQHSSERIIAFIRRSAQRSRLSQQGHTKHHAVRDGLRDVLRPHFWIPIVLVALVLLASGTTWEHIFWIAFRALTIGWVLFALARMIDPHAIALWLHRKGHWGPAMAFRKAMERTKS